MTRYSFYFRENWIGRSARVPLTEEEARSRHSRKEPYGATTQSREAEIDFYFGATFCAVTFSGASDEPELVYSFEMREGKLFLFEADYFGSSNESANYYFRLEGAVEITKREPTGQILNAKRTIDVSINWETVPDFGVYHDLLRRERSRQVRPT